MAKYIMRTEVFEGRPCKAIYRKWLWKEYLEERWFTLDEIVMGMYRLDIPLPTEVTVSMKELNKDAR